MKTMKKKWRTGNCSILKQTKSMTKISQDFLDLKEKQVDLATVRKEMEDTNNNCRSMIEKFVFNKKGGVKLPFPNAKVDLNEKLNQSDSYKNDSDTDAFLKADSADSYMKQNSRLQKRAAYQSSQISAINGVAFYADLTNGITTLGRLHPIVYDNAKTNIGGAYNRNDGIFTAPASGVYVFSWYMMALNDHYEELDIVVDGQFFAKCYSANTNNESASKTVVIELNKGSLVWIRTSANNGHGYIYGEHYDSCAGWLLYATL